MHVIHTVPSLNAEFGGPSRTVPALCASLAAAGSRVTLATQDLSGVGSEMLAPAGPGVELHLVRGHYFRALRLAIPIEGSGRLRRLVAQGHAAVLHDHGVWQPFNHVAADIARQAGIPRVVSPRGMLMRWPMSRSRFKKRLLGLLFQNVDLRCTDAFVATSSEEAHDLRKLGLSAPIAMIPNGVMVPSPREGGAAAELKVGFLSRLHPKKGLISLVRAWAEVRPANWRLEIAGPDEGGHAAEIRGEVTRLGLDTTVRVRPLIEDSAKFDFLRSCAVTILPSESENFGMAIAESLAAGVPVIASRGTPWEELAIHNAGWWVHNSVESLADALRQATTTPLPELEVMGARGRALIETRYSWHAMAMKTTELYAWLRGEAGRPAFVDCR